MSELLRVLLVTGPENSMIRFECYRESRTLKGGFCSFQSDRLTINMNLLASVLAIVGIASMLFAQTEQWLQSQEKDALRDTSYIKFDLKGRFLTAPQNLAVDGPSLVVTCQPGKHLRIYNGRFLHGFVTAGIILGSEAVQYRIDDGKIQHEMWSSSTNSSAAFFDAATLKNLLYGHILPHKEGTTAPVRKLVISVSQLAASEIVMQFDMPDPEQIADACGAIAHKK